ncbi:MULTISPECIES: phosphate signaling complex protein PhoU [Holzapfeliella]
MRSNFEKELHELHDNFGRMGRLVSENIGRAVKSFIDHDKQQAQYVIDTDPSINGIEVDLEKKSFEMIALQQPVTTDLRNIVTIMKASSDLERMADHAVSIAKATIKVKGEARVYGIEDEIAHTADLVIQLVIDALEAYRVQDDQWAREISKQDISIDKQAKKINAHIISEMKKDPDTILGNTYYMLVTSYLERIGDYATNICEWVVYLKTGKLIELNNHVKHDSQDN